MYAADFDMDTASWSATEVGIYLRLLLNEWVNGSLPNDTEQLARITRIDRGNFLKCWCRSVKGKFMENSEGKLINRRMEDVREKQTEYREKQRGYGLKGIEKKQKEVMG